MKIHSIFQTISGECGNIPQGGFCTFIRLQGCNLRCSYCDAKEALNPAHGKELTITEVLKSVWTSNVVITGGEPLFQAGDTLTLIKRLLERGHTVQVETNGTLPIPSPMYFATLLRDSLTWVVDYKVSQVAKMLPYQELINSSNLWRSNFFLKFVVENETQVIQAVEHILGLSRGGFNGLFAVSPAEGHMETVKTLMDLMKIMLPVEVQDKLIINIQIHKFCGLA